MIYTFVPEQSVFGVNRDFRKIDLTGVTVPDDIQVVQWDTVRETGVIEFKPDVMDSATVRDLEAEKEDYDFAKRNNKPLDKLEPRYKAVPVRRQRRVLQDFDRFLPLIPLWEAAAPKPPEPLPPREQTEENIPLVEVVRLLRQKGVFTAADIQLLKSRIGG